MHFAHVLHKRRLIPPVGLGLLQSRTWPASTALLFLHACTASVGDSLVAFRPLPLCKFGYHVCSVPLVFYHVDVCGPSSAVDFVLPFVEVTIPAKSVRSSSVKLSYTLLHDITPVHLHQKRAQLLLIWLAQVMGGVLRISIRLPDCQVSLSLAYVATYRLVNTWYLLILKTWFGSLHSVKERSWLIPS